MSDDVKCRCGYDKDHPWVSDSAEYDFLGWVMVCIGISALPTAVKVKCHQCQFVFERTTDMARREAKQYK